MIKIEIELREIMAPDGKVAGQMTCLHYNHPPVTEQEIWLRDQVFEVLKDFGEELGKAAGSQSIMALIPHNPNKRRKNDITGESGGDKGTVR